MPAGARLKGATLKLEVYENFINEKVSLQIVKQHTPSMYQMKYRLFIILFFILGISCQQNKTFRSIDSFRNSHIWTLAKLVQSEDTAKMREFVNSNPAIDIDELDSKFHKNLLIWAIFNGRYKSVESLLRLGADPNFTAFDGTTPLIYASRFLTSEYKADSRYIAILLKFGADPNKVTKDSVSGLKTNALDAAAVTSIEYVKYLIEKGKADPFVKVNNISPVEQAVIQDQLEIVDYLISSSNVSLHIPSGTYGGGRTVYDILVKKHYPSDSDLYTLQQRILQLQTTVPK